MENEQLFRREGGDGVGFAVFVCELDEQRLHTLGGEPFDNGPDLTARQSFGREIDGQSYGSENGNWSAAAHALLFTKHVVSLGQSSSWRTIHALPTLTVRPLRSTSE